LFDIFFYEDKKSFKYNTWLLAVDDNGVARWALIYVIKKHDASQKYPRVFNSLAEDGLFFAIKEMVIEHSHRSYLGNNINYKS
jgi:hypothetical protein